MPHVLIADDDAGLREALQELLSREGFEIEVAASVAEACRALERLAFDVVLSDVRMPGDGSTLPERLRGIRPGTPVILMTAFDEPGVRERATADGVVAYLRKPLSLPDLRAALGRALAREKS